MKPRTVTNDAKDDVVPSSIFGGARPVDTAVKEKEIEEKILQERDSKESHAKENGTTDADVSPNRSSYSHNRKARPAQIEEKSSAEQSNDQPERKTSKGNRKDSGGENSERKPDHPVVPKHYEEPKAPVCGKF